MTDTLHEELCTFIIIYSSILLRMRNFIDKLAVKIKPQILCSINFVARNCLVFEIMWRNMIQPDRPQKRI